jgi:hypothetical protein
MESACETCAYFRTGTEFLPILTRQRDHARDHGQPDRAALFDGLIQRDQTRPAHRSLDKDHPYNAEYSRGGGLSLYLPSPWWW